VIGVRRTPRRPRSHTRNKPRGHQLIHHDFHLSNLLYEADCVSGLVDWTDVRSGPRPFDVGYCRCDMSMLYGVDAADLFLDAYRAEYGDAVPQIALWDLAGATRAFPVSCSECEASTVSARRPRNHCSARQRATEVERGRYLGEAGDSSPVASPIRD
jgi:Ser/Thr protein kinase RdoA (MazF antagonist)